MKQKIKIIFSQHWQFIIAFLLIIWAFGRWFMPGIITWGDWIPEPIDFFLDWFKPNLWLGSRNMGMSMLREFNAPLWVLPYTLAAYLIHWFNFSYNWIERLFWFWPYIIIAPFSFYFFWRTFFPERKSSILAGILFFSINTYSMLLTMGGHINMAIAYALAPVILASVKLYSESLKLKNGITLGLLTTLGIYYEIRGMIIISLIVFAYLIYFFRQIGLKTVLKTLAWYILTPILLHAWWVIPFLFQRQREILPPTYQNLEWVINSSYTDLVHAITLYHPQWYDNVLGKINPVPALFFLIPFILVFSFLQARKDHRVRFFLIIALLSIFLTKGINPPLGRIYIELFEHFPLFKAFRDPSKFFIGLGLAYATLFAYLTDELLQKIQTKNLKQVTLFALSILPIIWLAPVYTQEIGGTFLLVKEKPAIYEQFAQVLKSEEKFYRILWLPKYQRFSYYSENHPRVSWDSEINNSLGFLKFKKNLAEDIFYHPQANFLLEEAGIRYLVIPTDSSKDIYKDYKPKSFYTNLADQATWLKKDQRFDLDVYELPNPQDIVYVRQNWLFTNNLENNILNKYLNDQKTRTALILQTPEETLELDQKFRQNRPYLFEIKSTDVAFGIAKKLKGEPLGSKHREFDLLITNNSPFTIFAPKKINPEVIWRLDDKILSPGKISEQYPDFIEIPVPSSKVGQHKLVVENQIETNLFTDGEVKDYQFKPQSEFCSENPLDANFSTVDIKSSATTDNNYLQLKSFNFSSCLARIVQLPLDQTKFRLEFDYHYQGGDFGQILITDAKAHEIIINLADFFKDKKFTPNTWYKWSGEINFAPNTQIATISLKLPATLNDQGTQRQASEIWLDNIKFYNQDLSSENKIYYGSLRPATNFQNAQVEIEKKNNGFYQAKVFNISQPHLLVLNTQFHRDWQATTNNKSTVSQPIKTNTFANGFFVQPRENQYTVDFKFSLNRFVPIGLVVSILTLIYLIYLLILKKPKP